MVFKIGDRPWNKGIKTGPESEETRRKKSMSRMGDKNPFYRKGYKLKGKNNPNWRGGKTTSHGYVYIYMPSHPNSNNHGYVKRCDLVAEKALARYLNKNKGELAHHVNGIKDDDRNENLLICNSSYHGWLELKINNRRNLDGTFSSSKNAISLL